MSAVDFVPPHHLPTPVSPVTPSPASFATAPAQGTPSPLPLGAAVPGSSHFKTPGTPTRATASHASPSALQSNLQNFSFSPGTPGSVPSYSSPNASFAPHMLSQSTPGSESRSRLQSPPPVTTPITSTFSSPLAAGGPPAYQPATPTASIGLGLNAAAPPMNHAFVTFTDPFAPSTSSPDPARLSPKSTPQSIASPLSHPNAYEDDRRRRVETHQGPSPQRMQPQRSHAPSPQSFQNHHQYPQHFVSPPPEQPRQFPLQQPYPTFVNPSATQLSPTMHQRQDSNRYAPVPTMPRSGLEMSRDSSLESLPSWTSHDSGLSAMTGTTSLNSASGFVEGRYVKAEEQENIDAWSRHAGYPPEREEAVLSPPVPQHPSIQVQLSAASPPLATPVAPVPVSNNRLAPGAPGTTFHAQQNPHFFPHEGQTPSPTPCYVPPPPFTDFDPNQHTQHAQQPHHVASHSVASTVSGASRPVSPMSTVAPSMLSDYACSDSPETPVGVDIRGSRFGISLADFDIERTLGTGTFGSVLLVRFRGGPDGGGAGKYYAMKVLNKVEIVRLKQVEHVNSEKDLLALVSGTVPDGPKTVEEEQGNHFCVRLNCTFQDERNLYLLLDFVEGGELFTALRKAGRFTPDVARFFAASVLLALRALHKRQIVYRDLKPENILLGRNGYIKITDFGFAKRVTDRTYTLCGTPDYLSPEIIQAKGHGTASDWWAFGTLLFELLAGYPPFFDDSPIKTYEKICSGRINFPRSFDATAKDLISKLLVVDLSKRLGNLKGGVNDVMKHPWFQGVPWEALCAQSVPAPITPRIRSAGDASYFEAYAAVPIEHLPGIHRALLNRMHGGRYQSPEIGSDPYRHFFESF